MGVMNMNDAVTRDVLQILCNGNEVPGLTVYAYRRRQMGAQPAFPLELWPAETGVKPSKLSGEEWLVWVWDVKVERWPDQWMEVVRSSLSRLAEMGGLVVWCGLEGYFADPPDLLSPSAMEGGVYAAFSETTGFICHVDIDSRFQPISNDEMLALRTQIGGSLT